MFNSKKEDEPNGIKPGYGSNLKTMNDLQSLQRDNEWPYGPERKEKKKKNRPMWLCLFLTEEGWWLCLQIVKS